MFEMLSLAYEYYHDKPKSDDCIIIIVVNVCIKTHNSESQAQEEAGHTQ